MIIIVKLRNLCKNTRQHLSAADKFSFWHNLWFWGIISIIFKSMKLWQIPNFDRNIFEIQIIKLSSTQIPGGMGWSGKCWRIGEDWWWDGHWSVVCFRQILIPSLASVHFPDIFSLNIAMHLDELSAVKDGGIAPVKQNREKDGVTKWFYQSSLW